MVVNLKKVNQPRFMTIINFSFCLVPCTLNIFVLIDHEILVFFKLIFKNNSFVGFLMSLLRLKLSNFINAVFYCTFRQVKTYFLSFSIIYFVKFFVKKVLHHQLVNLVRNDYIENASVKFRILLFIDVLQLKNYRSQILFLKFMSRLQSKSHFLLFRS